jgi:glycosyltransferase involved in cell wall biosynthesis
MEGPIADIIYPYTPRMTGIRRYSERLIKSLRDIGAPVRFHRVRKIEYTLSGKPAGGLISQRFSSMFVRKSAPVVHALAPDLAGSRVNLVTVHDLIPFKLKDIFIKTRRERLGYRLMFSRIWDADIIVQTETTKKELLALGISDAKVHVCGLSVDDMFRPDSTPSPYSDNEKRHLLTVGDFNPRKRFDIIYRAVANLKDAELYHIGPTNRWEKRREELASIAQKAGNIHMLGELPDNELLRYMQHADLFVFLSEDEGAGYPVAEAISCGVNAVVNDLSVFRELYGDMVFYTGLNEEELASAIKHALENPKDKEALLRYAGRFSRLEEARRVLSVYQEIARKH